MGSGFHLVPNGCIVQSSCRTDRGITFFKLLEKAPQNQLHKRSAWTLGLILVDRKTRRRGAKEGPKAKSGYQSCHRPTVCWGECSETFFIPGQGYDHKAHSSISQSCLHSSFPNVGRLKPRLARSLERCLEHSPCRELGVDHFPDWDFVQDGRSAGRKHEEFLEFFQTPHFSFFLLRWI